MNAAIPVAAATIVAPETRDLPDLGAAMAGWLADRIPGACDIRVTNLSYPSGAGMSHETILFDADWREAGAATRKGMVVRIKPTKKTVYQDDMFDQQYRLIQLMHESGAVRVAEPLWFEENPSLLGAPFFVMEKISGNVAVSYPPYTRQGWLFDSTPADRRRIWEDSVSQLAHIQHVPVSKAAFLTLPGGPDGFGQEVDRWRRFMDWVDPDARQATLRECFVRLMSRMPSNRVEGIVWGDARLGNMMIGPGCKVAAVMDWEQPSLGGALHDLAWWIRMEHNMTAAQGVAPLEGMGTRDETIALWSEISGKSAADIDWYEAFVSFKMDCLSIRMTAIREMPANTSRYVPGAQTAALLDQLGS